MLHHRLRAASGARGGGDANLVFNGGFDTDAAGWYPFDDRVILIESVYGEGKITCRGGTSAYYQKVAVTTGANYMISGDIRNGDADSVSIRIYNDLLTSPSLIADTGVVTSTSPIYVSDMFTATKSDLYVYLRIQMQTIYENRYGFFDNISLVEV